MVREEGRSCSPARCPRWTAGKVVPWEGMGEEGPGEGPEEPQPLPWAALSGADGGTDGVCGVLGRAQGVKGRAVILHRDPPRGTTRPELSVSVEGRALATSKQQTCRR